MGKLEIGELIMWQQTGVHPRSFNNNERMKSIIDGFAEENELTLKREDNNDTMTITCDEKPDVELWFYNNRDFTYSLKSIFSLTIAGKSYTDHKSYDCQYECVKKALEFWKNNENF